MAAAYPSPPLFAQLYADDSPLLPPLPPPPPDGVYTLFDQLYTVRGTLCVGSRKRGSRGSLVVEATRPGARGVESAKRTPRRGRCREARANPSQLRCAGGTHD
jgi:hypothetical protein